MSGSSTNHPWSLGAVIDATGSDSAPSADSADLCRSLCSDRFMSKLMPGNIDSLRIDLPRHRCGRRLARSAWRAQMDPSAPISPHARLGEPESGSTLPRPRGSGLLGKPDHGNNKGAVRPNANETHPVLQPSPHNSKIPPNSSDATRLRPLGLSEVDHTSRSGIWHSSTSEPRLPLASAWGGPFRARHWGRAARADCMCRRAAQPPAATRNIDRAGGHRPNVANGRLWLTHAHVTSL